MSYYVDLLMSNFFANQVFDGGLLVAMGVAMIAGVISFASPCVIPLVPGYLAYTSGIAATRRRVFFGSLLFITGFSFLFISYGALFGELGARITSSVDWLARGLGLFTIFFGVIFLFPEKFYRSIKFPYLARSGLWWAPPLGFMFGLGWTPCIGPTLGAVQALSFMEASALRGAILSMAYCIGLGVPFLLLALFIDRSRSIQRAISLRSRGISTFGGALLILIGLLQVTGLWELLMAELRISIANFVPVV
jgi:cytochrome c-type biogenesis protein